jgi:hypothetical protein
MRQDMLDAHQRETEIGGRRLLKPRLDKRVHIALCHESGGVPTKALWGGTRVATASNNTNVVRRSSHRLGEPWTTFRLLATAGPVPRAGDRTY